MRKVIIACEGGEGAGKSLASKAIVVRLNETGIPSIWTREPGGSPDAEVIRQQIFGLPNANADTMFGLFWAARAAHIKDTILPALARGEVVVSDRFDGSTWSYQLFGQDQQHLIPLFWEMRTHYLRDVLDALHYVYFDIDPTIGLGRVNSRGGEVTHFDERELSFHQNIRQGYEAFWPQISQECARIDASLPASEVLENALVHVLHWVCSNRAPP
jgi:dTMP kinase